MSLFEAIKADKIKHMKSKDTLAKDVLSSLIGDLETMSKNLGLDQPTDEQVIKKLKTYITNVESNIGFVNDEGRKSNFLREKEILSRYVPKQLDDEALVDTIKALVAEMGISGKQGIGPVMKALKDRFSGSFDGKRASEILKEVL